VAAERHGRLRAVGGQRPQPLALTAREHHPEDVGPQRAGRGRGDPSPRHGVAPIRAGPTGSVVTWPTLVPRNRTGPAERRVTPDARPVTRGYALPFARAHRPAHPRVPPGRLRRGRRPRRAPGARAARAGGRRRALLRRTARRPEHLRPPAAGV